MHYFQSLKSSNIRDIPSKPLIVQSIKITGLKSVGVGDGSDFSVSVFSSGIPLISTRFSDSGQCDHVYDQKKDLVMITLTTERSSRTVDRDTKFMFTCSTKGVPVGYDDCAFFFWINTHFIVNNRVTLTREQLDNPHKQKTWAVWRENFAVEIEFVS